MTQSIRFLVGIPHLATLRIPKYRKLSSLFLNFLDLWALRASHSNSPHQSTLIRSLLARAYLGSEYSCSALSFNWLELTKKFFWPPLFLVHYLN
jgi:hypothetical protein